MDRGYIQNAFRRIAGPTLGTPRYSSMGGGQPSQQATNQSLQKAAPGEAELIIKALSKRLTSLPPAEQKQPAN